MKSRIILFILALFVWLLLSWPPDWQHFIVGIFVSLFVAYMTGDLFINPALPANNLSGLRKGGVKRPEVLKHPLRYWYFIFYFVPVFLWECLKANIDVAYRVLHPKLPINPGIVKIKTTLKSDTGLTFLANSITLTPGTFSIDIDRDKGVLYIHWIDVKSKDVELATKIIAGKFERILKKIFE